MKLLLALLAAGIFAAAPVAASTAPPRIAFTSSPTFDPHVVTVTPDGSGLQDLTPNGAERFPTWSPDGSRLAFQSDSDPGTQGQIFVMNADGSDRRRLTNDVSSGQIANTLPAWSPRGDLIAFLRCTVSSCDVWVVDADGSGLRALSSDEGTKSAPVWSPDGTRILYARTSPPGSRIYSVGLDGAPPVALSPQDASDRDPAWSPDGSEIAFAATSGLTEMNADGSNRHQVSEVSAASPAWLPDGTRIAFTGTRSFPRYASRFGIPSRQDVFVVDPDGANLRRLTGPFDDAQLDGPWGFTPSWWPDGSRLFYVSQRNFGSDTTFVMNADGTCESLFAPGTPLLNPVWQPGGGQLPPIARCAELRLSEATPKTTIALNENAEFTLTVDNDGNLPATAGVIDVPVDPRAVWSAGSGNCSVTTSDVVCQLADLPPHGSTSVTIFAYRNTPGPIRVQAHVGARQLDTDTTNNEVAFRADALPCTQVGTYGPDVLYGTDGPDRICGLPGADTIYGLKGNDFIDAGNGDDRIYPGPGRDTVIAKGGDDVIYARDGQRDWIDCGAGYDVAVVDRIDVTRHCEVVVRPPH